MAHSLHCSIAQSAISQVGRVLHAIGFYLQKNAPHCVHPTLESPSGTIPCQWEERQCGGYADREEQGDRDLCSPPFCLYLSSLSLSGLSTPQQREAAPSRYFPAVVQKSVASHVSDSSCRSEY